MSRRLARITGSTSMSSMRKFIAKKKPAPSEDNPAAQNSIEPATPTRDNSVPTPSKSLVAEVSSHAKRASEDAALTRVASLDVRPTPMSLIIAKSFKDIKMLRGVQEEKLRNAAALAAAGKATAQVPTVDFDKIELNLKKVW